LSTISPTVLKEVLTECTIFSGKFIKT
jgi:hypothetical protein